MIFRELLDFVKEHSFSDTTQSEHDLGLCRAAKKYSLQSCISACDDFFATGQFWRLRASTWGKGIANRIHI